MYISCRHIRYIYIYMVHVDISIVYMLICSYLGRCIFSIGIYLRFLEEDMAY